MHGIGIARLRWTLGLLFVALAVPSAVLVVQTLRQLKWEAFHQQRERAVELAERIDGRLQQLVALEDARSVAEFDFVIGGEPGIVPQRSPLAQLPVRSEVPGLLGWFQVDADGVFSTPLLPAGDSHPLALGIAPAELEARRAMHDSMFDVLGRNRLVARRRPLPPSSPAVAVQERDMPVLVEERTESAGSSPPPPPAPAPQSMAAPGSASRADVAELAAEPLAESQVAFDRLNQAPAKRVAEPRPALGKSESAPPLGDERMLAKATARQAQLEPMPAPARTRRVEQSVAPAGALADAAADADASPRSSALRIFDSEIDPFEFARLDSGHFVLFRRVWRDGERMIQGALLEPQAFLRGALAEPFSTSALAQTSDLQIAWRGEPLQWMPGDAAGEYSSRMPALGSGDVGAADELRGSLLHRARLSAPLADMEMLWSVRRLPTSPGTTLVAWAGLLLFAVLFVGFAGLYRLGLRQLRLARQQQDFIAAVSHELKTPLTSIRMYGELLRAGWASEDKKREYYEYIHDESERLSRLIANVLQLARLERSTLALEPRPFAADTLFELIRSKVQAQIERAGFESDFRFDEDCRGCELQVDADALVQIVINLVDNALKFSARAPRRRVEIGMAVQDGRRLALDVRDFGPGVPADARRRVFELFWRGGAELTRETTGTGIGLALVRQLARAMGGDVDVEAASPGARFRLWLPLVPSATGQPAERHPNASGPAS